MDAVFPLSLFHYHFDYTPLWRDHLSFVAYCLLVLSLISCYVIKDFFLRGIFFLLSLLLGWYAYRLELILLPFILGLGFLFYYSYQARQKSWRGLSFLGALAASVALLFVKLPGIENWQVAWRVQLTPDAVPYSMALYFDKILIALFFLWFSPYTLANGGRWASPLKKGIVTGLFAAVVLIPLSYYLGLVKLELKVTNFFYLWAFHNLFFTCLAEEALFRGMFLKFLLLRLQHFRLGKWLALIMSAVVFGLAHFALGRDYMLLAGISGLFYGYVFIRVDKIEASVIAHFIVNSIHFLAFTYPALIK